MMFKKLALASMTFAIALVGSAHAEPSQVVAKDSHGRATEVSVNGQTYQVCSTSKQDECINPRAAGLNWGNRELDHWPGMPASETKQI